MKFSMPEPKFSMPEPKFIDRIKFAVFGKSDEQKEREGRLKEEAINKLEEEAIDKLVEEELIAEVNRNGKRMRWGVFCSYSTPRYLDSCGVWWRGRTCVLSQNVRRPLGAVFTAYLVGGLAVKTCRCG